MSQLDLTRYPRIRPLLQSRWPQFLVRAITLAGFVFTILAGLLGSPVGSHNFSIIFVWIAWWTALKLFFIPFGGRAWCSICPIPLPGEWLQQGGILRPGSRGGGLHRRWPLKSLKGNWLQAGGFLLIGLFSAVTLTTPLVSALVLLGIIVLALALSLVFERRAFCSHLCPIGGFSGLYAQLGPVEVRVKDAEVCAAHGEKTCYAACPWGLYPLALKSSADCGLCLECLRACPKDNIAVNLRPWGRDLGPHTRHRLGETFLGLVMLASALANAAVFLGPWGELKTAAFAIGSRAWWSFSAAFLLLSLSILPGLYALAVWAGQKLAGARNRVSQALAQQGQALVPLGLTAWMAFTVAFAFAKFGYVLPVISDPLGHGWNLLGVAAAGVGQETYFSLLLQVGLLAGGLFWAARVSGRVGDSRRAVRQSAPMIAFSSLFTLTMLWLLVG